MGEKLPLKMILMEHWIGWLWDAWI